MRDTSSEIEKRLREFLMSRTGGERLILGCGMFDDAKTLAEAGIRTRYPHKSAQEIKHLLFMQFYASDFAPEKLQKIIKTVLP